MGTWWHTSVTGSKLWCNVELYFARYYGEKDENNQPTPPIDSDFALKAYGSNCGKIVDEELHTLRPKSWHWIKSNIDIGILKNRFNTLDYSMSKDTVRQDSIGQQELIYLYKSKYN